MPKIRNRIIYFYLYVTSGLLSPVTPATTHGRTFYWQHPRDIEQFLFRLPFAQYLANPCGIGSASHATSQSVRPAADSTEPPDVHSRRFVSAFADRYVHRPVAEEARNVVARELHLVFREARHLVSQIHDMTIAPNCRGVQLQSLGAPSSVLTSKGDVHVATLYRQLLIATAHLHLMSRDIVDSSRYCFHESPAQRRLLELLASKLEMMMCLILQLESSSSGHFFSVTAQVLSTNVYRYNECSPRQIRSCLVLNYTQHAVSAVGHLFNNSAVHRADQEQVDANLITTLK